VFSNIEDKILSIGRNALSISFDISPQELRDIICSVKGTWLPTRRLENQGSIPGRGGHVFFAAVLIPALGPPNSYPMDTGDPSPSPGQRGSGMALTTFFPIVPAVKKDGSCNSARRPRLRVGCGANRLTLTCKMVKSPFVNGVLSTDMMCVCVFLRQNKRSLKNAYCDTSSCPLMSLGQHMTEGPQRLYVRSPRFFILYGNVLDTKCLCIAVLSDIWFQCKYVSVCFT
jgi:hypothetical protein